jgi:hypothetical protein
MSKREKIITLYSRNGIKITKTTNMKNESYPYSFSFRTHQVIIESNEHLSDKERYKGIEKQFTSKLGFYYWKKIYDNYKEVKKSYEVNSYTLELGSTKYELEYPTKIENNNTEQKIGIDSRPWDLLPGYKGMPQNFIDALLKETKKFLDLVEDNWKSIKTPENFNIEHLRKRVMIELFGYEDGPKIQPNDIKILSHGFDLKESFRGRKES